MKPWSQVVTPHSDIRTGKLDESVFAADLSDVVAERGPLEYRDAVSFFRKTYPTRGLAGLLSAVLRRLSGKGNGEAVIQIQTPFGGGKTHSLIALYHLIKHWQELKGSQVEAEILAKTEVRGIPEAAVVSFVGTAADVLKGRTPWGEIAGQLGCYELLKSHDTKRLAPGKDLLHQLLASKPTLILMDEVVEYAVKAKEFRDQAVAFFQELTETVKVLPQVALVVTLPSSAPYGEDGERALHELQQVFRRVESIKTPVEGEEIYEVIRRRLFEDIGDPQEARQTVDAFFEMYQRLGDDVSKEVREPAYRKRMLKAYPFHPELIDVLFERWSTYPDFQRTRGVLRLLANLVGELYQSRHQAPLILPAHINLSNPAVRGEFLRHIGNEFQGVIVSDIDGPNAKAERIDRELGSEYARFGVATGLARAIFFASFSGSERRGVGIQRLRLATVQPGMPPAIIGDALRRLEDELWYLHVEGGVYQFSNQPNLNRVIVEKEEAVKPEQITEEIKARTEKHAGNKFRVTLWPRTSQDLPDTKELKLAIFSPEYTWPSEETSALAGELLEKCGQKFRAYKNTLLLLVADEGDLANTRQNVKRYLAYRAIADDKALMRQLSGENKKALENKIKDIEGSIDHQLLSTYRHLLKAEDQRVQALDLGLPTVGIKVSLADRVYEYLEGEGRLLRKISPRCILQKALTADEKEKSLSEVYECFLKYPNLPLVESKEVLFEGIVQGCQEGIFGLQLADQVFFKQIIDLKQLDDEAILVREPKEKQPEAQGETLVKTTPSSAVRETSEVPAYPGIAAAKTVRAYFLKAVIPWDKFSDFVRGVVTPLRQEGAETRLEVSLEAKAEDGIKQTTLDQKVKETLSQIGAEVLEEKGK
ncbi:MAG: DUF499 domain-containing protein [Candidatus Omnitrophica bacterium]|nr:DUF499 domain-containing protein [Candidatus Omnitrophota bacterium]